MGIRIKGTALPVWQKVKGSYHPTEGLNVQVPCEGAGDHMGGLAQNLINNRIAFTWERSGAVSKIVASASGGQAGIPNLITDEWQITANELNFAWNFSPKLRRLLNSDIIDKMKEGVDAGKTLIDFLPDLLKVADGDANAFDLAKRYYRQ